MRYSGADAERKPESDFPHELAHRVRPGALRLHERVATTSCHSAPFTNLAWSFENHPRAPSPPARPAVLSTSPPSRPLQAHRSPTATVADRHPRPLRIEQRLAARWSPRRPECRCASARWIADERDRRTWFSFTLRRPFPSLEKALLCIERIRCQRPTRLHREAADRRRSRSGSLPCPRWPSLPWPRFRRGRPSSGRPMAGHAYRIVDLSGPVPTVTPIPNRSLLPVTDDYGSGLAADPPGATSTSWSRATSRRRVATCNSTASTSRRARAAC